jgi:hypothetical protein
VRPPLELHGHARIGLDGDRRRRRTERRDDRPAHDPAILAAGELRLQLRAIAAPRGVHLDREHVLGAQEARRDRHEERLPLRSVRPHRERRRRPARQPLPHDLDPVQPHRDPVLVLQLQLEHLEPLLGLRQRERRDAERHRDPLPLRRRGNHRGGALDVVRPRGGRRHGVAEHVDHRAALRDRVEPRDGDGADLRREPGREHELPAPRCALVEQRRRADRRERHITARRLGRLVLGARDRGENEQREHDPADHSRSMSHARPLRRGRDARRTSRYRTGSEARASRASR